MLVDVQASSNITIMAVHTSASMNIPQTISPIFSQLPPELKIRIFELFLYAPKSKSFDKDDVQGRPEQAQWKMLVLNKKIRAQLAPKYYQAQIFNFNDGIAQMINEFLHKATDLCVNNTAVLRVWIEQQSSYWDHEIDSEDTFRRDIVTTANLIDLISFRLPSLKALVCKTIQFSGGLETLEWYEDKLRRPASCADQRDCACYWNSLIREWTRGRDLDERSSALRRMLPKYDLKQVFSMTFCWDAYEDDDCTFPNCSQPGHSIKYKEICLPEHGEVPTGADEVDFHAVSYWITLAGGCSEVPTRCRLRDFQTMENDQLSECLEGLEI